MADIALWQELIDVMATLRGPEGCPWDKAQDHHSLKRYFLEETYEVLDEIDAGNDAGLCDELGDALLQVVFHARLAEERGAFSIDDVVQGISRKMIRRHPHIFCHAGQQNTAEEVLSSWEEIKAAEKKDKAKDGEAPHGLMQINQNLPALMLAEKVQSKARRVHVDWLLGENALRELQQQAAELNPQADDFAAQLGRLLFLAVAVGREQNEDAELCLRAQSRRFIKDFSILEERLEADNKQWHDVPQEELNQLWQQVIRGQEG